MRNSLMILLALAVLIAAPACTQGLYYGGATMIEIDRTQDEVNAEFRSGKDYDRISMRVRKSAETGELEMDLEVRGASGVEQMKHGARVWIEGIEALKEAGEAAAPMLIPAP